MKALKFKITSLKEKLALLEKDRNKLHTTIENDIKHLSSYHQTINKALFNKKNYSNCLKKSLANEELIKAHYALIKIIIDNNEKLIQINDSKSKRERDQLCSKKDNIENDINAFQSSIELINKEIINMTKAFKHEGSGDILTYIINPSKENIENFNEICIQKELVTKFKKKSIETRSLITERSKQYTFLNKELKSLKQEKGIKEVLSTENESTIIPDVESIGSLDNEIENNIDSPKFLKKVKQISKINFAFNKKLELNAIRLRQHTIQPKEQQKKVTSSNNKSVKVIMPCVCIEQKKPIEDKWKIDKAEANSNISLDHELERTRNTIKEMTHRLGELLYKNRVLVAKQLEVANKTDDVNKKIHRLERTFEKLKRVYEPNVIDSSSEATEEIDVLANANLYPLPA